MAFEDAEKDLFRALNGAGSNPALDGIALLLDVSAALYVITLWAAHLWLVRKRSLAFDFLLALLVTVAVTEVLKFAIGRLRPEDVYANVSILRPALFPDFTDPSFPSGHTSRAFLLVAVVGLHERKWLPALLPYGVLAGLARVYEGAHYPSDVLAGALLGLAIGVLFWRMDTWPPYVRLRGKLIGRWLSPAPGGRYGSRSRSGRDPA
jgi:undecaprenyl-diphosphatase